MMLLLSTRYHILYDTLVEHTYKKYTEVKNIYESNFSIKVCRSNICLKYHRLAIYDHSARFFSSLRVVLSRQRILKLICSFLMYINLSIRKDQILAILAKWSYE